MSLSLESTPPVVSRQLRLPGRSSQDADKSRNLSKLVNQTLFAPGVMSQTIGVLSLKEIGAFAAVCRQTKNQEHTVLEHLKNRSSLTLKEAIACRKMTKSRFENWHCFFKAYPKLTLLDLGENSLVTLKGMSTFSDCRLTIEIGGCSNLTEKDLPALKRLCPDVVFQRTRAKTPPMPAPSRLESFLCKWFFRPQPHPFPHETPGL